MTSHYMTHDTTWPDTTSHWHDVTWHLATNHITSFHVTSQPTTLSLLHLTSQPTTWHHSTLHHHHRHTTEAQPATTKTPPPDRTAEGWCTQKTRFGHRTGLLPCAHSIGNVFLWLVFFPPETSAPAPGSPGNYSYHVLQLQVCRIPHHS